MRVHYNIEGVIFHLILLFFILRFFKNYIKKNNPYLCKRIEELKAKIEEWKTKIENIRNKQ